MRLGLGYCSIEQWDMTSSSVTIVIIMVQAVMNNTPQFLHSVIIVRPVCERIVLRHHHHESAVWDSDQWIVQASLV